jgi:cbb3-type cytochrome oxidase subunit 3
MKLPRHSHSGSASPINAGRLAFTLAEMMVTAAIFMLLMGGLIYCYIFGLNLHQITRVKLGASDEARNSIIHLTDEIRSATRIKVGDGDLSAFTEAKTNGLQVGNAIQIYPTSAANNWIRYFYDTNTNSTNFSKLIRSTDGVNLSLVIAHSITNIVPLFTAEDSWGKVLTDNENNRVIGMTLQFSQIEYPIVQVGPGNHYDFYQLHTRITRRRLY